ncbi:NAD(P)/FAD-dependent oxidoreductase [Nitrosomonas communis]|uniref:Dehydrogenase (Flavoprotein) n=1 Tax=Nitrosomonas communis TaxID=44574 RepID=A0A1H2ZHW2_9PROT|nr:FAD-dependent monooxygenase [Nitrosomonas communis]SDX16965.1 Dehydrogenase (flavoprotein) [Nitrosomonas communis]
MKDSVLIIGGGPAGLALAIVLSRTGLDVWVTELSNYTQLRIGEHLPPSGVQALNMLVPNNLLFNENHLNSSGVDAYWGHLAPNRMDYLFHPIGVGVNLSRPAFDRDLALGCREAGANIVLSTVLLSAEWKRTYWLATLKSLSGIIDLHPKLIVDATGRCARFARIQGANVKADDQQFAVINMRTNRNEFADGGRVLIEATENGWWYRAPLASDRSVTMYMTDADMLPRGGKATLHAWWINQLHKTNYVGANTTNCVSGRGLVVRCARSQRLSYASGNGWLAVGDAAIALDPLASRGISKGLEEAWHSADIVLRYLSGSANVLHEYADKVIQSYSEYKKLRHSYYLTETRWPIAKFWRRRQYQT